MQIDFLNSYDKSKSIDWNQAQLINWYLVSNKRGKSPLAAYPTPGTSVFSNITGSVVRGMYEYQEILYAVIDNTFYSIASDGTTTSRGTLLTSTGRCQIANITNQIMIIDASYGYNYNTSTHAFNRVLNTNDGQTVQSITITAGGSNYVSPTVSFSGGGGSGAAGTVIISSGVITSVTITNPGSGYTSAPSVSFSDSTGSGSTATASVNLNNLPTSLQSLTAQDEMFLVSAPNSNIINYCNISNGLTWNGLNFFSKTRYSENIVCIISLYGYLYVIGANTTELYYNDGVSPWALVSPGVIETGCAATNSVCVATGSKAQFLQQSSAFWLAKRKGGGYQVIETRANQYYLVSEEINEQLKLITSASDAFAYIYEQEGHEFYVITFPTDQITFVYDISTKSWHQRTSYIGAAYTRHISNCYAFCYGKQLVGDFQSGKIYYLDSSTFTENGTAIQRTLVTYPFYKDNHYLIWDRIILDWETGVGNGSNDGFHFYYSKDNGHSFTEKLPSQNIGSTVGNRFVFDRWGAARDWRFKVQTTMTVKPIMIGAVGELRVSSY